MIGALAMFRFVVKASLECAGFGLAGEFLAEVVPDVARRLYERWQAKPEEEVRAEVQAVAAVSEEEARAIALEAVTTEAAAQPPDVRLSLVSYLTQLPLTIRQTQRRPADPSGSTIHPSLRFTRAADVLPLLPPRLPRFRTGQQAPGFPDWRLDELLGIGGFGEVWKATNPHLEPVALKYCLDPTTARYLRNEAGLLGQVIRKGRHPGIVALLDTALTCDPPCLKYEYVSGGDLSGLVHEWHQANRQDLVALSLRVMGELAGVLAFAHDLMPPIVHRDLKPANVLARKRPGKSRSRKVADLGVELAVADFGIGAVAAGQGLATFPGATVGSLRPTALRGSCTPLYASPQQMRGEPADPRDDVFALGVIWYQVLTGELDEKPGSDWREELQERGVSERVLAALGRCLAGKADRRWRNAGELAAEIGRLRKRKGAEQTTLPIRIAEFVPDEEEDLDEDPLAAARRLAESLGRAQKALAYAVELSEKHYNYAGAVEVLEAMPESYCDMEFLEVVRQRRDRVNHLRSHIRLRAEKTQFAGLRDSVDEWLTLVPNDAEARTWREVIPYQPGLITANSLGMRLVLVPAGKFEMGAAANEFGRQPCESPAHQVEISRSYYLGAYPVTQEQYARVTGRNPSHFANVAGQDTRLFPVENVSWEDAMEFCRRLSALPEEQREGRSYRLPTEAEWEHACRGGEPAAMPFSHGWSLSGADANFDGRQPYGSGTRGEFLQRTCTVGAYPANKYQLHDMHGQVWEWCADWLSERWYRDSPRLDPRGPRTGEAKVVRGGCWQSHGRMCRSASREWFRPGYRSFIVGFRVVLEVGL